MSSRREEDGGLDIGGISFQLEHFALAKSDVFNLGSGLDFTRVRGRRCSGTAIFDFAGNVRMSVR